MNLILSIYFQAIGPHTVLKLQVRHISLIQYHHHEIWVRLTETQKYQDISRKWFSKKNLNWDWQKTSKKCLLSARKGKAKQKYRKLIN